MKRVLQVIQSFPARSSVFLAVWRGTGSDLHIHANNRDAFIDSVLNITNEDPYKSGGKVYFLDSSKLLAFVMAYRQFVFSFDEEGDIYYESPYALYKLDTLTASLDDVRVKSEVTDSWSWIPFPVTKAEIGIFKTLYGFAVKISDSKVLIDGGKVEAFYTLYKFSVKGETKVKEKVIVRRLDLPTIQEISNGDLWFAFTANRLYFKFELGIVSFLRVPYDASEFMYPESFAQGPGVGEFQMDISLIRQALKLTNLFNVNTVEFKQDGDSVAMVVSDQVKFKVGRGSLLKDFLISTEMFSRVLGTVDVGEVSLDVTVTEQGMDLVLNREPVQKVYSLARVSLAQYKKDVKSTMRSDLKEEQIEKRKAAGLYKDPVNLPPDKSLADMFKDGEIF
jgi:hypothetical protein